MSRNKDQICKNHVVLLLILGTKGKHAVVIVAVENILLHKNKEILLTNKTLKHSTPYHLLERFVYYKYQNTWKLCIINCLHFCLAKLNRRTDPKPGNIIVTHAKPH